MIKRRIKSLLRKDGGYTLLELSAGLTLLVTGLVIIYGGISAHINRSEKNKQRFYAQLAVQEISNRIVAQHIWLWDVDTDAPEFMGNPYDISESWKQDLIPKGLSRIRVDIGGLQAVGDQFQWVAGNPNHSELMELKVRVDTLEGVVASANVFMAAKADENVLKGLLVYFKQALKIYYHEQHQYPDDLDALVLHSIIPNIPNNPYTERHHAVTNAEESLDWSYSFDSGMNRITLYPRTHPSIKLEFDAI